MARLFSWTVTEGRALAGRGLRCVLGAAATALVLATNPATAATITVDTAGDGTTGCTLRRAVQNANDAAATVTACTAGGAAGNTIAFLAALNGSPIVLAGASGPINVTRSLTIQGNGAANTVIDGNSATRLFDNYPGNGITLAISGVTLRNGRALNSAGIGSGGALWIEPGTTVTIAGSVLSNNHVDGSGGAIYVNGTTASLSITGSTFSGNTAAGEGGALRNIGALAITGSTFSGNAANWGGAIYSSTPSGTDPQITNSTFSGNQAVLVTGFSGYGGAIMNDANDPAGGGNVNLKHVTVTTNTATGGNGGGIFSGTTGGVAAYSASAIVIDHSLLAGNTAASGSGPDCATGSGSTITSADFNALSSVSDCTIGGTTTNNAVAASAANLLALGGYGGPTQTVAPTAGNPAIDIAPSCASGVTTDQRGALRGNGGPRCDAGAFEAAKPLTVGPLTLAAGQVGVFYSQAFSASGGTGPYSFAVTLGTPPAGLSISAGVLSGTPTAGGSFNFTVTATDTFDGTTGALAYALTVNAPTITIAPATLPGGIVGVPYSQSLTASGGTATYEYTVSAGAPPAGLTLSAAGLLSGPPSAAGTFHFTVKATDSSTGTGPFQGSRAYSITIVVPSRKRDFDGNGRADVFWQHAATGETYIWLMNGLSIASSGSPATVSDPNWVAVGTGDFDGGGKSDVFWRHAVTGETYVWLMNGAAIASSGYSTTVPDLNWKVLGSGDFDGDGKTDLFWQHAATGETYVWLMNGAAIAANGSPATVTDANWKVAGIGDFDGNGKADVFWRHAVTGQTAVWLMNAMSIAASAFSTTVTDLDWKVAGTADFDGNGKSDVFWRHAVTGQTAVWLMNGAALASSAFSLTVPDLNWKVMGTGDYDGNGKADVFWRHAATGQTYVWLMNGASIVSSGSPFTVPDLNWEILNPK